MAGKIQAIWIGHSTVLLTIDGTTILTDPVLGQRCGLPVGPLTIGPKRLTSPALEVNQLPHIDLVLLSHAHMDHFDIPTLRNLENDQTAVVTARATSDLLRLDRWQSVQEVDWGRCVRVGPLSITGLRVNHWGARIRTDTHRGYNGYLIEAAGRRVIFGGDTAFTTDFRDVRSSQPVDLGIMPIGAYNPWIHVHCTPEQALRMSNDAGAEQLLPVHHQTFRLGRENFFEPIDRFVTAAGEDRVLVRNIGDQLSL